MKSKEKLLSNLNIAFINPPILDFAMYNLFAEPLGILKSIYACKKFGANVIYIDSLDRTFDKAFFEKGSISPTFKDNGSGKYWKKLVDKPEQLQFVDREFYRFGLDFEKVSNLIKIKMSEPDLIVISIVFTYHYLAARRLLEILKNDFPGTKVILSGIYPTIYFQHAKTLGFDEVFTGNVVSFVSELLKRYSLTDIDTLHCSDIILKANKQDEYYNDESDSFSDFLPDWDAVKDLPYGIIRLTKGCPFSCPYCASNIISGKFEKLSIGYSLSQMRYFAKRKIYNIAFYDDALLIDKEHFITFMEKALEISTNFRFYLPNAIHIARADEDIFKYLKYFRMIRFGLESLNMDDFKYGNKFNQDELNHLINNIERFNIDKRSISFYILFGLPGQDFTEVERTVKGALKLGISPRFAEFSPIPGTKIFDLAKEESLMSNLRLNIEEPLYQNPCIYPYYATEFTIERMKYLRSLVYDKK